MKRNGQMQKAGVPSAGTYTKGFFGWRKSSKAWREGMPLIDTRHRDDLTMAEYSHYHRNKMVKSGYKYERV